MLKTVADGGAVYIKGKVYELKPALYNKYKAQGYCKDSKKK